MTRKRLRVEYAASCCLAECTCFGESLTPLFLFLFFVFVFCFLFCLFPQLPIWSGAEKKLFVLSRYSNSITILASTFMYVVNRGRHHFEIHHHFHSSVVAKCHRHHRHHQWYFALRVSSPLSSTSSYGSLFTTVTDPGLNNVVIVNVVREIGAVLSLVLFVALSSFCRR